MATCHANCWRNRRARTSTQLNPVLGIYMSWHDEYRRYGWSTPPTTPGTGRVPASRAAQDLRGVVFVLGFVWLLLVLMGDEEVAFMFLWIWLCSSIVSLIADQFPIFARALLAGFHSLLAIVAMVDLFISTEERVGLAVASTLVAIYSTIVVAFSIFQIVKRRHA